MTKWFPVGEMRVGKSDRKPRRSSPPPVFDSFRYAKTEGEGLGFFLQHDQCMAQM